MRIPSTSDLVYAQTNKAYDKLAVLSENLDKLEEIYDFIFKYKEYIHTILEEYIDNEQLLGGVNSPSANDKDVVPIPYHLKTKKIILPHNSGDEYYGEISVDTSGENGNGLILKLLDTTGTELGRLSVSVNEAKEVIISVPNPVDTTSAVNLGYLNTTFIPNILTQATDYIDGVVKEVYEFINTNFCTNGTLDSVRAEITELRQKLDKLEQDIADINTGVSGSTSGLTITGYAPNKPSYTIEELTGGCKLNTEYLSSNVKSTSITLATIGDTYGSGQIYKSYSVSGGVITFTDPIDVKDNTYICIAQSTLTPSLKNRVDVKNHITAGGGTQPPSITTITTSYDTPIGFKISNVAVFQKI